MQYVTAGRDLMEVRALCMSSREAMAWCSGLNWEVLRYRVRGRLGSDRVLDLMMEGEGTIDSLLITSPLRAYEEVLFLYASLEREGVTSYTIELLLATLSWRTLAILAEEEKRIYTALSPRDVDTLDEKMIVTAAIASGLLEADPPHIIREDTALALRKGIRPRARRFLSLPVLIISRVTNADPPWYREAEADALSSL